MHSPHSVTRRHKNEEFRTDNMMTDNVLVIEGSSGP